MAITETELHGEESEVIGIPPPGPGLHVVK